MRIRYRQALQSGTLIKKNEEYYILFDDLQKGITPGQFAAWYQDGVLIGSAVIEH
jgi:tRNA-specific 2-thiouridylase